MQAIIFEDINEKFGYGEYLGFKVIIMKENGYINASKMLKDISHEIGKEKKMNKWRKLEQTPDLIKAVENTLNEHSGAEERNSSSAFSIVKGGVQNEQYLQGTYVHQDLIVHIASWASPIIAIKVSKIVNEIVINQYKRIIRKQKKELKKRDKLLDVMDEIIYIHKTNNDNEYWISRVNKRNRGRVIKKLEDEKKFEKVAEIVLAKNSVAVSNHIISFLKINDKVKSKGNLIKLDGITIQEVIEEINKVVTV